MHFLGAGLVEELYCFPKLRAANYGVVHEQQLLAAYEPVDGQLLHLCHLVPYGLVVGHEGPRPGRRILYEGPCEGLAAAGRIAYGVGHSGVGNAGHVVHVGKRAAVYLGLSHALAVVVAHKLHVYALVIGVRIAVVAPKEGADLHVLARRRQHFLGIRGEPYDLAGAQLAALVVAELAEREGLEGHAVRVFALSHVHRCAPQGVARRYELALVGHDYDAHGALNAGLGVLDTGHEIRLAVYERGDELRDVYPSGAHYSELVVILSEYLFYKLFRVVDDAYRHDGVYAELRPYEYRLRVCVANAAYAAGAVELIQIILELSPERCVCNVVQLSGKTLFPVPESKSCAVCAEMAVVIGPEENVQDHAAAFGDRAEESTHRLSPFMIKYLFSICSVRRLFRALFRRPPCALRRAFRQAPRPQQL